MLITTTTKYILAPGVSVPPGTVIDLPVEDDAAEEFLVTRGNATTPQSLVVPVPDFYPGGAVPPNFTLQDVIGLIWRNTFPDWDAAVTDYGTAAGSIKFVTHNGKQYVATGAVPVNSAPDTNPALWQEIGSAVPAGASDTVSLVNLPADTWTVVPASAVVPNPTAIEVYDSANRLLTDVINIRINAGKYELASSTALSSLTIKLEG